MNREEQVTIPCGEYSLDGLLSRNPSGIGVLLVHPHPYYGGTMYNDVISDIQRMCNRLDISTLRFNFSQVHPQHRQKRKVTDSILEITSSFEYLKDSTDSSIVGTIGYSYGGSAIIASIPQSSFSFVITLSASVAILEEMDFKLDSPPSFDVPMVLLHGREDRTVPPEDARVLHTLFPKASLSFIDHEGHFFRYDRNSTIHEVEVSLRRILQDYA